MVSATTSQDTTIDLSSRMAQQVNFIDSCAVRELLWESPLALV
jgi:hypothetical protein